MRNKLIEDINNYILYLNKQGLAISVHGKAVSGLLEHNFHKSPYCEYVKSSSEAQNKCIACQQKVYNRQDKEFFLGMCHAGVEEYVFYTEFNTFISVSGYGIHREKALSYIDKLCKDFYFKKEDLLNIYDSKLKHTPENIEWLKTLIYPLCHMLSFLQLQLDSALEVETQSKICDGILHFIQRNITQNITVKDIAQACSCSESTVAHIFKKYMNESIKKYIMNSRMKMARHLLEISDLSVTDIAFMCGFPNSNHFSVAFKKSSGFNPTKYRRVHKLD